MRHQSGFTLLEILLVLVLVSLASVAVISTLPVNAEDGAKQQAQSLYYRVQLLNEEAILSGQDFGLYVDEERARYELKVLTQDGWIALEDQSLPDKVELEHNLTLSMTLGGGVWADKDRLFEPGSLFDEEMFAEFEQEKQSPPPQIFIMSSGEITPVSLAIYPQNQDAEMDSWRVIAKENGQILLLAPGEADEES
ncbi:type II secretion system minor pseudopilin GspH [Vibrio sp. RE86]|uniref:type II secretion system minor pseudopilin GspH n=1 Tax=Vibrio sp. RE86 TaxID=2607605 RepID=UPI0014939C52